MNSNLISIKHLSKDLLIHELWKNAKVSEFAKYTLVLEEPYKEVIQLDVHHMLSYGKIELSLYYGKLLYIDITDDISDMTYYNLYNGYNLGQKVIAQLKLKELEKIILNYYISK
jgi:hypothetical protein